MNVIVLETALTEFADYLIADVLDEESGELICLQTPWDGTPLNSPHAIYPGDIWEVDTCISPTPPGKHRAQVAAFHSCLGCHKSIPAFLRNRREIPMLCIEDEPRIFTAERVHESYSSDEVAQPETGRMAEPAQWLGSIDDFLSFCVLDRELYLETLNSKYYYATEPYIVVCDNNIAHERIIFEFVGNSHPPEILPRGRVLWLSPTQSTPDPSAFTLPPSTEVQLSGWFDDLAAEKEFEDRCLAEEFAADLYGGECDEYCDEEYAYPADMDCFELEEYYENDDEEYEFYDVYRDDVDGTFCGMWEAGSDDAPGEGPYDSDIYDPRPLALDELAYDVGAKKALP